MEDVILDSFYCELEKISTEGGIPRYDPPPIPKRTLGNTLASLALPAAIGAVSAKDDPVAGAAGGVLGSIPGTIGGALAATTVTVPAAIAFFKKRPELAEALIAGGGLLGASGGSIYGAYKGGKYFGTKKREKKKGLRKTSGVVADIGKKLDDTAGAAARMYLGDRPTAEAVRRKRLKQKIRDTFTLSGRRRVKDKAFELQQKQQKYDRRLADAKTVAKAGIGVGAGTALLNASSL